MITVDGLADSVWRTVKCTADSEAQRAVSNERQWASRTNCLAGRHALGLVEGEKDSLRAARVVGDAHSTRAVVWIGEEVLGRLHAIKMARTADRGVEGLI